MYKIKGQKNTKPQQQEEKDESKQIEQSKPIGIETEAGGDGVDRSEIIRNGNGSEEPHSNNPELWNIDGTEMDLNQKYKMGGQMW